MCSQRHRPWTFWGILLLQAFRLALAQTKMNDVSVVSAAEGCIKSGVLDFSFSGSGVACVSNGGCRHPAEEAYSTCVRPRLHTGVRDIALTLHIPCGGCTEPQGVVEARAAWFSVARLLRIPLQEIQVAILLLDSQLRQNLEHFTLRGQSEQPMVEGSPGVSGNSESSVDLFVAMRINTDRLDGSDAGLQALRLLDGSGLGNAVYVFEIAEQLRSQALARKSVTPSYRFAGLTWNAPPSTLRGGSSVLSVTIDWLDHVPLETAVPRSATREVKLLAGQQSQRGLQLDGENQEEDDVASAIVGTLLVVGSLATVFIAVGCTFYCLQAGQRRRQDLDRIKDLAETVEEWSDDSEDEKLQASAAPGSLQRPTSSRAPVRPSSSRSQRSRPGTRGTAVSWDGRSRPGSAESLRRAQDRQELRKQLRLETKLKRPADFNWMDVETPNVPELHGTPMRLHPAFAGKNEFRPDTSNSEFRPYTSPVRISKLGSDFDLGETEPPLKARAPEFDFLSGESLRAAAAAVAALAEEQGYEPGRKPKFRAKTAQHFPRSQDFSEETPEAPSSPPPSRPSSAPSPPRFGWDQGHTSTTHERPGSSASTRSAPAGQGDKSANPKSAWTGFSQRKEEPSYGERPRPSSAGSYRSQTGEYQRPATLKARARTPQPPPPTPASGRFKRAATAAANVFRRGGSHQTVVDPVEFFPPAPEDLQERAENLINEMTEQLETSRGEPLSVRKLIFRDLQRQLHPDKNSDFEEAAKHAFQELMKMRADYLKPD
mmetsp:Transcript_87347/g.154865  ORF Transcript_87347/g.154865 Transcript_87347/m.154865 type:complete len:770 (+) Transcript_87347:131-2440(+)